MDLPRSATSPGTEPTLHSCHGGPNQRWTLESDDRLTGLGGVCLDGATSPRVTIRTCDGSAGQRWQAGAQSTLRNAGQCLAPAGSATANGTPLTRTPCADTPAQRWTFTP
ncbi:hypothetical protein CP968_02820 [Streptomyces subrutilus]|uniref:Ricin B lectin domain-containing protein n=1 Tax=Streptomyces subrutilus TaxID=36818 RepID=A0A5P2UWR6_9ACTN|nr:hypothetical protein CP968_02820 [Streptomyces subrutilus]